jgi:ribonuclease P protein component
MRQAFGREEHIRKREDFQRAYAKGARLQGRHMTVFLFPTDLPVARLGIAATRKIGNAITRNLAKRLIREIFRRNKPAAGTDLVVIPRASMAGMPLAQIEADYRTVLARRRPARPRSEPLSR